MELYEALPDKVEFEGKDYALNLAFDRVLAAMAIQDDPQVPDEERMAWMMATLVPDALSLPPAKQAELLRQVFDQTISFSPRKGRGKGEKTMDFSYDADLLYASFMQAYGIDLFEEAGKLHWWKFYSLLQGLPSDTKLMDVISIRQREVPAPTRYNQKEIRSLLELKQYYAIPGRADETYDTGLVRLWNTLEKQATP